MSYDPLRFSLCAFDLSPLPDRRILRSARLRTPRGRVPLAGGSLSSLPLRLPPGSRLVPSLGPGEGGRLRGGPRVWCVPQNALVQLSRGAPPTCAISPGEPTRQPPDGLGTQLLGSWERLGNAFLALPLGASKCVGTVVSWRPADMRGFFGREKGGGWGG